MVPSNIPTVLPTITPTNSPTTAEPTFPTVSPTEQPSVIDVCANFSVVYDNDPYIIPVVFTSKLLLDKWSVSPVNTWELLHFNTNNTIFSDDSSGLSISSTLLVTNDACLLFNSSNQSIENGDDCYYFKIDDPAGDGFQYSQSLYGETYWLDINNYNFESGWWPPDGAYNPIYEKLRIDFCIS